MFLEPDRPQTTIWRVRIARCMPKVTNTHSEYVTLTAFPLQQWFHERLSLTLCVHCLSGGGGPAQIVVLQL